MEFDGEKQREERKEREKEKKEKRKRMRRKGERNREGKEDRQLRPLSAFRQSEFVGKRVKVCLRDEGYAPRGRDSSSFGYFHPKGCLAVFYALMGSFDL